jgi:hypothetical protein
MIIEEVDILGSNPRTSSKNIQGYPLTKKNLAYWSSDCCTMLNGVDGLSFLDMPFDPKGISVSIFVEQVEKLRYSQKPVYLDGPKLTSSPTARKLHRRKEHQRLLPKSTDRVLV